VELEPSIGSWPLGYVWLLRSCVIDFDVQDGEGVAWCWCTVLLHFVLFC